ncbi:hypothetical protein NDU88_002130 [Pleurodeles waltl]|uniref:Uncharacterized protein n=1 Tax=Pleurodeles waltl TaxID=8319 RepID=A0AAV7U8U0_PLEWA|nr:hypothetical protein NDU88_002130 [Pleurodeles waltl]
MTPKASAGAGRRGGSPSVYPSTHESTGQTVAAPVPAIHIPPPAPRCLRTGSQSPHHRLIGARHPRHPGKPGTHHLLPRRAPPAAVRSCAGTPPLTGLRTTSLRHWHLTPKRRLPPPKSTSRAPTTGSAPTSSGPPPPVGAQLKCRTDGFNKGPTSNRRRPRRQPRDRPNTAALTGSLQRLQRCRDPSASRRRSSPGPPSAHASAPRHSSLTSEPRQAPPPDPPTGRAVPQLLPGNGRRESRTSACVTPPPVRFLPVLAAQAHPDVEDNCRISVRPA